MGSFKPLNSSFISKTDGADHITFYASPTLSSTVVLRFLRRTAIFLSIKLNIFM